MSAASHDKCHAMHEIATAPPADSLETKEPRYRCIRKGNQDLRRGLADAATGSGRGAVRQKQNQPDSSMIEHAPERGSSRSIGVLGCAFDVHFGGCKRRHLAAAV